MEDLAGNHLEKKRFESMKLGTGPGYEEEIDKNEQPEIIDVPQKYTYTNFEGLEVNVNRLKVNNKRMSASTNNIVGAEC